MFKNQVHVDIIGIYLYEDKLPDKTHSKTLSSEYRLCLHVWVISQVEFEQAPARSYQNEKSSYFNSRVVFTSRPNKSADYMYS